MKSVDRPLANPKRITIESSQEFFSVEILCSVSTADPPNTKHYVHRPAPIERPAVIHEANDKTRSGDDDDDFMTRTKKRNATGSPIKILRKTCTKRMKVVETPRHAVCSPVFFSSYAPGLAKTILADIHGLFKISRAICMSRYFRVPTQLRLPACSVTAT
jgi:hypothetical protein